MSFTKVAKVKKAQGLKGELFLLSFSGETSWLPQLTKMRLLKPDGTFHSESHIVSRRVFKNGCVVKLEGVEDRTQAETMVGLILEIPETALKSAPGELIYLNEVLGFTVHDAKLGVLGPVKGFSSNGAQDLLVVESTHGLVEIPFVKPLLVRMDFSSRDLFFDLPEGLVEVAESETQEP